MASSRRGCGSRKARRNPQAAETATPGVGRRVPRLVRQAEARPAGMEHLWSRADCHHLAVERRPRQKQRPAARPTPEDDLISARRQRRNAEGKSHFPNGRRAVPPRQMPKQDVWLDRRSRRARWAEARASMAAKRPWGTALRHEIGRHPDCVPVTAKDAPAADAEGRDRKAKVRLRCPGKRKAYGDRRERDESAHMPLTSRGSARSYRVADFTSSGA